MDMLEGWQACKPFICSLCKHRNHLNNRCLLKVHHPRNIFTFYAKWHSFCSYFRSSLNLRIDTTEGKEIRNMKTGVANEGRAHIVT
jgi:hypothetical protein